MPLEEFLIWETILCSLCAGAVVKVWLDYYEWRD